MAAVEARTFVKCKSFKVERLLDISNKDAIQEGVEKLDSFPRYKNYMPHLSKLRGLTKHFIHANLSFFSLFESINGKEILSKNPWVFAYEFELIREQKTTAIKKEGIIFNPTTDPTFAA